MFSAAAVRRAFSGAHDSLTLPTTQVTPLSTIIISDKLYEDFRMTTAHRFISNYDALTKQLEAQRLALQARANSPDNDSRRRRTSNRNGGNKSTHTNTQHGGARSRRTSDSPRSSAGRHAPAAAAVEASAP